MASVLKVDRIETPSGTGNISFAQPMSGDGNQITNLNLAGANMSWTGAVIPAGQISGTIATGVDGSGLINLPAVPPDLTATNAWTGPQRATLVTNATGPFDMDTGQNFLCTPTAPLALTFSNPANGQSGYIILDNSVTGHAITKPATTKTDTNLLATVTAAGIYIISYISDGTTTYLTNSAAMV